MALQLALPDTNVGLPAPEAYARIVAFAFDAKANKGQVAVDVYATKAARLAGKGPVSGGVFEYDLSADPTVVGAGRPALYAWLNTLPTFMGALDV